MANYREIVTKAVIAKGKKLFTTEHDVKAINKPTTILGVWVINHNFNGVKDREEIKINGSFDVNVWYSYDNDTKSEVLKDTIQYSEIIRMRNREESDDEDIIVRSLKQPNCINVNINDDMIHYSIEKELGVELVGDVKVKIQADDEEDPWEEIVEDNEKTIDNSINEEYLSEGI